MNNKNIYQRNRGILLEQASEYYRNNKEKLNEQARNKYRNMSEQDKQKLKEYKKTYQAREIL